MTNAQLQKIIVQIADHEARISALECSGIHSVTNTNPGSKKRKTIQEIVKGRKFKNGSEKLAVIVGYHEKLIGSLIKKGDLRKEWQDAKITGMYKTNLLDDASGTYVRVLSNEECDLTQTGEEFFDNFLKNEPTESTSR